MLLFLIGLSLSCKKKEVLPLPAASFYAEVKNCQNDTCIVFFYDNSTNAVSRFWNFGNGKTSIQISDSAAYIKNSAYNVKLTVKNSDGVTAEKTKIINI